MANVRPAIKRHDVSLRLGTVQSMKQPPRFAIPSLIVKSLLALAITVLPINATYDGLTVAVQSGSRWPAGHIPN